MLNMVTLGYRLHLIDSLLQVLIHLLLLASLVLTTLLLLILMLIYQIALRLLYVELFRQIGVLHPRLLRARYIRILLLFHILDNLILNILLLLTELVVLGVIRIGIRVLDFVEWQILGQRVTGDQLGLLVAGQSALDMGRVVYLQILLLLSPYLVVRLWHFVQR